jgi:hypothetical protein
MFSSVFPEAETAKESWGSSGIDYLIASVLRHHLDDIQLVWPDENQ